MCVLFGLLLRILLFIVSCVLAYAAMFLYEKEEHQVQNVLEEYWIRINDFHSKTLSWHVSLMKGAAELATSGLDRLFGRRMLSFQVVGVSGCLSLVSLHLVTLLLFYRSDPAVTGILTGKLTPALHSSQHLSLFDLMKVFLFGDATIFKMFLTPAESLIANVVSLVAIVAVAVAIVTPRFRHLPIVVFGLTLLGTMVGLQLSNWLRSNTYYMVAIVAICTGVICDIGAVTLTRQLIKWQAAWTSIWRMFGAAVIELAVSLCLIVGPVIAGMSIMASIDPVTTISRSDVVQEANRIIHLARLAHGATLSATTNIISAVLALSFFCSTALLFTHRLFWPLVDRGLYRIVHLGVFRSNKARLAVIALAVELMDVACYRGGSFLGHLLRSLIKLLY